MAEQTFPAYQLYLPDHIQGPAFLYNAPYVKNGALIDTAISTPGSGTVGVSEMYQDQGRNVVGHISTDFEASVVAGVKLQLDPLGLNVTVTVLARMANGQSVIVSNEDLSGFGPANPDYNIITSDMVPCGETDESGLSIDPKITYVDSKNAQFTHAVKTVMSEQGFEVKGVLMHGNPRVIQDFLGFPISQFVGNTPAASPTAFGVNTTGFGEPSDPLSADMQCNYEAPYKTWFIRHPSPGFQFNPKPYGDGTTFNPRGVLAYLRLYKAAIVARTFKAFTHKSEFTCSFTLRVYIDDTITVGSGSQSRIGQWHTYQPKILT